MEKILSKTDTFYVEIPKIDIQRFKGIMKVMGWKHSKTISHQADTEEEWTEEQEREAFLYTSRVNASKIYSKYL